MHPDIDGQAPATNVTVASQPIESSITVPAVEDKSMKMLQLIEAMDAKIKTLETANADLQKQIGALAGRQAAAPAAPAEPELDPQERAFRAMLEKYGLKPIDNGGA